MDCFLNYYQITVEKAVKFLTISVCTSTSLLFFSSRNYYPNQFKVWNPPKHPYIIHVTKWWLFCKPIDYSPPGSSVHGISRHESWSGLPFPPPRNLPDPGMAHVSPTLAGDSLPLSHLRSPSESWPWINPVSFLCLLSSSHEVWLGQCYFSRMGRWITNTNGLICLCVLGFPSSWGIDKNSCWFSCFFFFWCWLVCFDLAFFEFRHKFVHWYQREGGYKLANRLAESPDICFGFRWAKKAGFLYDAAWLNRVLDWAEDQCQVSR